MRIFGTLLVPLASGLVTLGFYLLGSAFLHPLEADTSSLLAASVLLSLGFVALSYFLRSAMSRNRHWHHAVDDRRLPRCDVLEVLPVRDSSPGSEETPLAFHRTYVDPARVRR